jgi:hypothetical protein
MAAFVNVLVSAVRRKGSLTTLTKRIVKQLLRCAVIEVKQE